MKDKIGVVVFDKTLSISKQRWSNYISYYIYIINSNGQFSSYLISTYKIYSSIWRFLLLSINNMNTLLIIIANLSKYFSLNH